ncbi:hypothetical protein H4R33_000655 [Dimargaris cristalligena]|nr:hypothetical protein H4R33_000655 [Dimargaris cristalligena]
MLVRQSPITSLLLAACLLGLHQFGQGAAIQDSAVTSEKVTAEGVNSASQAGSNTNAELLTMGSTTSPCAEVRRIHPLVQQFVIASRDKRDLDLDSPETNDLYKSYFKLLGTGYMAYLYALTGHRNEVVLYPYSTVEPVLAKTNPLYACLKEEPQLVVDLYQWGNTLVQNIRTDVRLAGYLEDPQLALVLGRRSKAPAPKSRPWKAPTDPDTIAEQDANLTSADSVFFTDLSDITEFPEDTLTVLTHFYFSNRWAEIHAVARAQGNAEAEQLLDAIRPPQIPLASVGHFSESVALWTSQADHGDRDDAKRNSIYDHFETLSAQFLGETHDSSDKPLQLAFTKLDASKYIGPVWKQWGRWVSRRVSHRG